MLVRLQCGTQGEKCKKYRAKLKLNGKFIHIGYFKNEVDAALAYNKKALELFGEFACVNIMEDKYAKNS